MAISYSGTYEQVIYTAPDGTKSENLIFKTSGTLTITGTPLKDVSQYVVGGGGGGITDRGGGGGGGGVVIKTSDIPIGTYSVTLGGGGSPDNKGGNSTFNGMTAYGGASNGGSAPFGCANGNRDGGYPGPKPVTGGIGGDEIKANTGGNHSGSNEAGGGGGGAGNAGGNSYCRRGGGGGNGYAIPNTDLIVAPGGGGGNGDTQCDTGEAGGGGGIGNPGSGGNGGNRSNGGNATAYGGGGGGGGSGGRVGGSGYTGVVVLVYLYGYEITTTKTGNGTISPINPILLPNNDQAISFVPSHGSYLKEAEVDN